MHTFQEHLARSPQLVYPTTCHYNVSAAQTLADLRNEVQQLREMEHRLRKQIHRYRASLDDIQATLYVKINKANEMQNFMAAISRLPNEMLLAIFEEVVAGQDPGAEERAEFTISKVSRRWRDLVIHSPRLWRRVCITPHVAPSILEVYKARASRALDIEIWGWRDRRDFQRFDAAIEMMLDSFGRWRSLSIACVCDTHLSHLTLKLSQIGHFSGLRYFTFRALRPGQTCSISFLMETTATTQPQPTDQVLSPCIGMLKSLDVENFTLTGDLGIIRAHALLSFSRLSSLTLRRGCNDARAFRITIDFSAFRAMLNGIPNLTTLVLHGQPLRFRTDPVGVQQGHDGTHGSAVEGGGIFAIGAAETVSLPQLHTLVLHPGVLKPRYLQHTISAIYAPALRHFELVFPDSKFSGQNISERLFVASPASDPLPIFATEKHMDSRRLRQRFPRVDTVVLHNASNSGTALLFIQAFPNATQVTLGGFDVGFLSLALRSSAGSSGGVRVGMEVDMGIGPTGACMMARSGSGTWSCDCTCIRFARWNQLRTLTLRQPRPETFRVVLDWIRNEYMQGHVVPTLVVEGSLNQPDIQRFAKAARVCTRVELVGNLGTDA